MSDETTTSERVGFCQDCGKPLSKETIRTVGTGVFCEPCLHARLTSSTASAVPPVATGYTSPAQDYSGSNPHPWLAGVLSIIPGVGQVYNGQYAKGIVILLICAVLDSLGKHLGIFGVAAFGWWVYQIVDAYQTAKARVEGRPLPNPFELNDIGEKLGFGKGFGMSAETRAAAYGRDSVPPAPGPVVAAQPTPGAPWTPVGQNPAPSVDPVGYTSATSASYSSAPSSAPYAAPVPPTPYSTPYAPLPNAPMPPMPPVPAPGSSFPLIAVWLIGLGVLFAFAEWVPVWRVNASTVSAIVLGALAASIIVRRLGYMGGISYHGPILHMMRGPVILAVVAVLFLLQGIHAATLGQTWPVFLVALGALLLGERLSVGTEPYPQSYNPAASSVVPPAAPVATTESTTSETQHTDERDGYSR